MFSTNNTLTKFDPRFWFRFRAFGPGFYSFPKFERNWTTIIYLTTILTVCHQSTFKPPRDKTNKMACAPSEDSDQPGHPPILIRVFAVRMKKAWILRLHIERTANTLIRLGGCTGWSESSLGAQSFCRFCHEAAHFIFTSSYLWNFCHINWQISSCLTKWKFAKLHTSV